MSFCYRVTFSFCVIFFVTLFSHLASNILSIAYLTVANLVRLGISVYCHVSAKFLSLWLQVVTQYFHLTEGLLSPTGTEPTPFWNSASKVAGLQVHVIRYIPLYTAEEDHSSKNWSGTRHTSFIFKKSH